MLPSRPERLLRIIDSHWIVYVPVLLLFLVMLGCGLLLFTLAGYGLSGSHWLWPWAYLAATMIVLAAVHFFFFFCMGEKLSRILITDRRLIEFDDILIIREDIREFTFDKMKSVEARKHGVLQYALNYGSLLFEGGNKGIVKYVPHPSTVARDIVQAMGMS